MKQGSKWAAPPFKSQPDFAFNEAALPAALPATGLNLRILGIPLTGAKSRVETHIKLCLQLVDDNERRVARWQSLRLPQRLLARDRSRAAHALRHSAGTWPAPCMPPSADQAPALTATETARKGGDAPPPHPAPPRPSGSDMMQLPDATALSLDASVVCASAPDVPVDMCASCVRREVRKRAMGAGMRCHERGETSDFGGAGDLTPGSKRHGVGGDTRTSSKNGNKAAGTARRRRRRRSYHRPARRQPTGR